MIHLLPFSSVTDFGEQHPFSGKSKPKNVTVNFVSRKGAMQLSWGGKSGVPLETIFGVTKGINTDVSSLIRAKRVHV